MPNGIATLLSKPLRATLIQSMPFGQSVMASQIQFSHVSVQHDSALRVLTKAPVMTCDAIVPP